MSDRSGEQSQDSPLVVCKNCVHYYVTWDKSFPHGCKAMGFKAKSSPASRVREASGVGCLLFEKKGSGQP